MDFLTSLAQWLTQPRQPQGVPGLPMSAPPYDASQILARAIQGGVATQPATAAQAPMRVSPGQQLSAALAALVPAGSPEAYAPAPPGPLPMPVGPPTGPAVPVIQGTRPSAPLVPPDVFGGGIGGEAFAPGEGGGLGGSRVALPSPPSLSAALGFPQFSKPEPEAPKTSMQGATDLAALLGPMLAPGAGAGTGAGTGTISIPGPGPGPGGGGDDLTKSLIRKREGFRESPYFDVNALRAGYGSDTATLPDGTVVPVTPGVRVTRDMAEADLSRRVGEFQGTIKGQIGEEAWGKLSPGPVAALTSVAYNYGKLPDSVAEAAKSGDPERIAAAIAARGGDNDGVNRERRLEEAAVARGQGLGGGGGGGLPGPVRYEAPRLGTPPAIAALKAADPTAFDRFNALQVIRPPELSQGERLTNILAAMAAGAQGTKTIGDFLLGAGAGALGGAAGLSQQKRREDLAAAGRQQDLDILKARMGVEKAGAVAQAQNTQIAAANENARRQWEAGVEQAKLDTAARNKTAEDVQKINLMAWEQGQPQMVKSENGFTVYRRTPEGGFQMQNIPLTGEGGLLKGILQRDKLLDAAGIPKDHPARASLENLVNAAEGYRMGGIHGVREMTLAHVIHKIGQQGQFAEVLPPPVYKSIMDRVQKSLTPQEMTSKDSAEIVRRKFVALLHGERAKNPKLEEFLLRATADKFGHEGAGATARMLLGQ